MTNKELSKKVVEETGVIKRDTDKVIPAYKEAILEALEKSEKGSIFIAGLGTFTVKTLAKRTGWNPKTKEKFVIPAKKTIRFKPSKAVKVRFN